MTIKNEEAEEKTEGALQLVFSMSIRDGAGSIIYAAICLEEKTKLYKGIVSSAQKKEFMH